MQNQESNLPKAAVGAVILAAGQSRRMGQPKLILPWGNHTVIEQVVWTVSQAGVKEIIVVTGGARELVEHALASEPVKFANNPNYQGSEMMTSLQVGMRACSPAMDALLVVLGDQPAIQASVVGAILETFQQKQARIIIPSYQMRRGHPWLIDKSLWSELLEMPSESTLRDFLQAHQSDIIYAAVDTPTILKDMDTPDDYRLQRP